MLACLASILLRVIIPLTYMIMRIQVFIIRADVEGDVSGLVLGILADGLFDGGGELA